MKQRGVTMSPRIQVYTTVACRALHRGEIPGSNLQSLTIAALDCSGSDVSARAVKIQACAYITWSLHIRLKHTNSHHNAYERLECNYNRILESPRRYPWSETDFGTISGWCPCHVPSCLHLLYCASHLLCLREFFHVLVMNPNSIFGAHAEQVILVGPILEGLVGALSSYNGIVHS
jgi:hypothetical protein